MAETATQFETPPEQRWKLVWERREAFADVIDLAARAHSVTVRGRARQVSSFLRRDGSFESAIVRPDVIAFTQPLVTDIRSQAIADEQLAWAASNGLNSLNCQPSSIQRLSQLMIYPALIAIAGFAIYLGFAFYVAPEFEQMFEEFGIELPSATRTLFGLASSIRSVGWLIGIVLVASLLVAILWLRVPGAFISRFRFLEKAVQNKRQVMADLAFHAAQLRTIGLSAQQAFAAASSAAGLPSANQGSPAMALEADANELSDGSGDVRVPGYALLQLAMRRPANHANDQMLFEVADCYRRRIVTVSDWWIQWLAYGFQCFVIACVMFIVLSMFMPLFSIIGGLTG